jgi:diguanylate cyclase (GGDEF)-like protein
MMGFLIGATAAELAYVKWMYLAGFVLCEVMLTLMTVMIYINKTMSNDERVLRSVMVLTILYVGMNGTIGYLDYFCPEVNYYIVYALYWLYAAIKLSLAFRLAFYFKIHIGLVDRVFQLLFKATGWISALALLLCATQVNGNLFISKVGGRLVYGPGDYCIKLIAYSLLLYLVFRTIYLLSKPSYYSRRDEMAVVLRCFAIATPFLVAQFFWQQIPAAHIGITLACLLVYVSALRGLISKDPLTDLENSKQLYIEMDRLMRNSDRWSVIVIDIDHFASINEEHGYDEGDMALIITTGILKNACAGLEANVYRHEGNSFVITCNHKAVHTESAEISRICSYIKHGIKEYNDFAGRGYNINVSIGFSTHAKEDTIPSMLGRAQDMLRSEKYSKYDYLNVEEIGFEDDDY